MTNSGVNGVDKRGTRIGRGGTRTEGDLEFAQIDILAALDTLDECVDNLCDGLHHGARLGCA